MFPFKRQPLKPNWWTITPVLASLVLWGAIAYIGLQTKSALDDKAGRAIYATVSDRTEAATRKQPGQKDCLQPDCPAQPATGAPATPSH